MDSNMKGLLILLLLPLGLLGQKVMMFPSGWRAGGGAPDAPTLVSTTSTAFNSTTTPKTTASISVNSGDILVAVIGIAHDVDATFTGGVSGGSLTWNLAQDVSVANFTQVAIWTTTATSTTSFTVSFTNSNTQFFGGTVFVFRNSAGVGASAQANVATSTPSVSVTTTAANSALVYVSGDWNAVDGTSRTHRTVNSITPTNGNGLEKVYFRDAAQFTLYVAYINDAGAIGSKTVGLSAPAGQTYSIAVIEIKGD